MPNLEVDRFKWDKICGEQLFRRRSQLFNSRREFLAHLVAVTGRESAPFTEEYLYQLEKSEKVSSIKAECFFDVCLALGIRPDKFF
jgi:hypothetical protein